MKINIGDVVEVQYPKTSPYFEWNGFRLQVTKVRQNIVDGTVLKTVPTHADYYHVGREFSWGALEALVIVGRKNELTSNQVYIDHIYERLMQNITPEELISLAERLDRAGKGVSLPK